MERKDVFELIEGEREYQDANFGEDLDTPIANFILYMRNQLAKAEEDLYSTDNNAALEHVRKATALGVACMENNETLPR